MADFDQPRNRKQQRAAARDTSKKADHLDQGTTGIKLAQPDRSGPKSKTLFELADERQALLDKGKPFAKQSRTDEPKEGDGDLANDPLGTFGDAVLYGSTLSMLHFTLDVLVYHQYRQDIEWREIFARTGTVLPILFFLVYVLHSEAASRFAIAKQIFYLVTAVVAGCYMVYIGNMYSYFAVLKRAPPVGTLWVWSVIEMRLAYALTSLAVVGGFLWWGGFTIL
ncbi:hypothetical protein BJ546DRAFT_203654 [Cryomyces antarcticus]|nr:hypothetical protein LTR04_003063 [Oleoguttula sp. CCFEE 6159]